MSVLPVLRIIEYWKMLFQWHHQYETPAAFSKFPVPYVGWGDSTFFQDEMLQQTGLFFFCKYIRTASSMIFFCICGCHMGFLVSLLNILGFGVTTSKLLNISFVLWHLWFNRVENCCLVAVYCVVCCCLLQIRSQEPWISYAFFRYSF